MFLKIKYGDNTKRLAFKSEYKQLKELRNKLSSLSNWNLCDFHLSVKEAETEEIAIQTQEDLDSVINTIDMKKSVTINIIPKESKETDNSDSSSDSDEDDNFYDQFQNNMNIIQPEFDRAMDKNIEMIDKAEESFGNDNASARISEMLNDFVFNKISDTPQKRLFSNVPVKKPDPLEPTKVVTEIVSINKKYLEDDNTEESMEKDMLKTFISSQNLIISYLERQKNESVTKDDLSKLHNKIEEMDKKTNTFMKISSLCLSSLQKNNKDVKSIHNHFNRQNKYIKKTANRLDDIRLSLTKTSNEDEKQIRLRELAEIVNEMNNKHDQQASKFNNKITRFNTEINKLNTNPNFICFGIRNIINEVKETIDQQKQRIHNPTNHINTNNMNITEDLVHYNYVCNGCKMAPIIGVRHQCIDCDSFNLCNHCKAQFSHQHKMKAFNTNSQDDINQLYNLGDNNHIWDESEWIEQPNRGFKRSHAMAKNMFNRLKTKRHHSKRHKQGKRKNKG